MRSTLHIVCMFMSGSAALIYEIVWVRRLGDLLGQDIYAINIVLTIFFLGLGIGGWFFGHVADRTGGGIWLFLVLELTIAASALLFDPALSWVDHWMSRWSPAEPSWQAVIGLSSISCLIVLAIPTMAMGGTLAAMSRHVIVSEHRLAGTIGRLYGANTLGAAVGVVASTFLMIPHLGVGLTMRGAVLLNIVALGAALAASRMRGSSQTNRVPSEPQASPRGQVRASLSKSGPSLSRPGPSLTLRVLTDADRHVAAGRAVPLLIAFSTGFVSVGFELLWTRGLSSRFTSGVYSFAIILCVYLLCIGVGALLVDALDRRGWVSGKTCALVVILAGLSGTASPAIVAMIPQTSDLYYGDTAVSFAGMEWSQFARAMSVMAASLLLFGMALPMLVRLATRDAARVGTSTGLIYLVNSMGAVLSPVVIGFLVMPSIGLGWSFVLLGGLLACIGMLIAMPWASGGWRKSWPTWGATAPIGAVCVVLGLQTDIRAWRSHPQATLVDYREGPAASVSVVDRPDRGRVLQVNMGYTLGGSRGVFAQQRQGLWPFLLQPDADSALFLGLGTGCTAGAAYEVCRCRIDALEIIPEVVDMLPYYKQENLDLLGRAASDPNLRLLCVDGRHFVRSTDRRYDVVIGDLFEPWRQGAGGLYAREHFESIARLLPDNGTFWQWLPLYQLAEPELKTTARTFCDVFPHVEVWWLEFNAEHPAVAFVGGNLARSIDHSVLERSLDGGPGTIWIKAGFLARGPVLGSWICGRQTLLSFAGVGPINTAEHPLIEFNAPRSLVDRTAGWGATNMQRMFELAAGADADSERNAMFPDPHLAATAARYRPAVERMLSAHARQLSGKLDAALDEAIAALSQTPEWGYPVEYINMVVANAVESDNAEAFDAFLIRLEAAAPMKSWAAYWRARRSLRMNDATAAEASLRNALRMNPNHRAAATLLAELERGKAR